MDFGLRNSFIGHLLCWSRGRVPAIGSNHDGVVKTSISCVATFFPTLDIPYLCLRAGKTDPCISVFLPSHLLECDGLFTNPSNHNNSIFLQLKKDGKKGKEYKMGEKSIGNVSIVRTERALSLQTVRIDPSDTLCGNGEQACLRGCVLFMHIPWGGQFRKRKHVPL
ncbi:MAG: hypothetical protein PHI97_06170 [Desulfobulbus sp.]|nr:hypothetical protein [Desulfobulbus sp.]